MTERMPHLPSIEQATIEQASASATTDSISARQVTTMTVEGTRVSPTWLALREAADAAARAVELVTAVRRHLAGRPLTTIHDLGCGTGSMRRWLAPQLSGAQHWIMHDLDAGLLELAANGMIGVGADGIPVTVDTRRGDITRLTAADFEGAGLVTASALLDMMTADEIERIVAACVGAGCPALLSISVAGRVDLSPADPLDKHLAAAFNAHQRRAVGGRRLLGPDAFDATVAAFGRRGVTTVVRASPWRLGGADHRDSDLLAEWLLGWVGAACEQRPELAGPAQAYMRRRLAEAAEGRLGVVVHHHDLRPAVDESRARRWPVHQATRVTFFERRNAGERLSGGARSASIPSSAVALGDGSRTRRRVRPCGAAVAGGYRTVPSRPARG